MKEVERMAENKIEDVKKIQNTLEKLSNVVKVELIKDLSLMEAVYRIGYSDGLKASTMA